MIVFNSTSLSQVVSYNSYEEYCSRKIEEYDEYTLYLVRLSSGILQLYYGSRKLGGVSVVEGVPSSQDYPVNRLYFRVVYSKDRKTCQVVNIYYKMRKSFRESVLFEFDRTFIRFVKVTDSVLTIELSNGTVFSTLILDGGKLSDSTLEKIRKGLESDGIIGGGNLIWIRW